MDEEKQGKRGMDSKDRLLKFFRAKGHFNLVWRCVDLHELSRNGRVLLLKLVEQLLGLKVDADAVDNLKSQLLKWFPDGYVVIPMAKLEALELLELEYLQVVSYEYKQIRLEKGIPHRVDPCEKCEGKRIVRGQKCDHCEGEGVSITFLEVSDEEALLAETEVTA